MPVTINGSGSIAGLSVGGLGSGVVNTATLANGAAAGVKLGSGSVIQTVSSTFAPYGDAGSDRGTSTTYSNTGIVLSITPTVSTSKILVLSEGCSFGYKSSDSQVEYLKRLIAHHSRISTFELREIEVRHTVATNTTQRLFDSWSMVSNHDHNTTNTITYKVQHKTATATYAWARYKGATMTLMEIAG